MNTVLEFKPATVGLGPDERDRRWTAARHMMAEQGFDLLVVFGLKSRERMDAWFANESSEGIVIFPARGEPIYISWHFKMVSRRFTKTYPPDTFWIDDFRVGEFSAKIIEAIREFGAERGTIGTIGVDTKEPAAIEGYAPFRTWEPVLLELPKATFRDATYDLAKVIVKKSAAEIRMVRRSAEIGEAACQAFLDVARPGVPEHDLRLAVTSAILRAGASEIDPIIMTVGRDDVGWARPLSYYTSVPRYLSDGDLIMAELFPCYAGLETQQQMAVSLGKADRDVIRLADNAKEAYRRGLETIRPGAMFSEVCATMLEPIESRDLWTLTPMLHSVSPLLWVSPMARNIAKHLPKLLDYGILPKATVSTIDLRLEPGMVFALEPNACDGQLRVNIGGSVLVTDRGVEELNTLANELHVIG